MTTICKKDLDTLTKEAVGAVAPKTDEPEIESVELDNPIFLNEFGRRKELTAKDFDFDLQGSLLMIRFKRPGMKPMLIPLTNVRRITLTGPVWVPSA